MVYILFLIPMLSLFIDKCYGSGMIFRRFYLLLIRLWMNNWRRNDRWKRFFIKPFICIYCYNTWITLFYCITMSINVFMIPLFLGFSYFILELFLFVKKKL